MHASPLQQTYESLKAEAVVLAGGLRDLAQRATVYHHLYAASGGNHAFPLIAAHGTLWAGGYFRRGLRWSEWLSWQYALSPRFRRLQLQRLADFADAFRDINRRVCVETYINFHFTSRHGLDPAAAELVPADLLGPLNQMHAARRAGSALSDAEKLAVFEAHFRNEQQHIVGPAIAAAVAAFDWPLVRYIALRPLVRFAYFSAGRALRFRNFADRDERIARGLTAFELAAQVGWKTVEQALRQYDVLPEAFFAHPVEYFARLRSAALQTA
jgi:hypothetical protein